MSNISCSYVVGNSVQLLLLTEQEREHLDESPWVFSLNLFPLHWKLVGFRPTVWVLGDNHHLPSVLLLRDCLDAITRDNEFRQRLKHIFLGSENHADAAKKQVQDSGIEKTGIAIKFYPRGNCHFLRQPLGKSMDDTIFHFASTVGDLANIAWILNPGQEIRLLGCPNRIEYQHFYSSEKTGCDDFLRRIWQGFGYLKDQHGLPLVDCNHHHDTPVEGFLRKKILDD